MNSGTLTLVPSGGLANRMRAVASAYSLCEATGSRLQVVWFRDWALDAAFNDIFEPVDPSLFDLREARILDFIVNDRPRRKNLWIPKLLQMLVYPPHYKSRIYEREVTPLKRQGFDFEAWQRGHRCYMSCYQVFGSFPDTLYGKLFRPVRGVMEQVERNECMFSAHTIGMHIRRTDNMESIEKSPTQFFIDAGRKELESYADLKIFLATDSEDVKREMREEFGNRIITAGEEAFRGNVDGIRGGLADMYTLARTQCIYGSAGSSFSEMASYIGGKPLIRTSNQ